MADATKRNQEQIEVDRDDEDRELRAALCRWLDRYGYPYELGKEVFEAIKAEYAADPKQTIYEWSENGKTVKGEIVRVDSEPIVISYGGFRSSKILMRMTKTAAMCWVDLSAMREMKAEVL